MQTKGRGSIVWFQEALILNWAHDIRCTWRAVASTRHRPREDPLRAYTEGAGDGGKARAQVRAVASKRLREQPCSARVRVRVCVHVHVRVRVHELACLCASA
eukprot:5939711-Pleurochrysis_carterae.AAC.1